MKPIKVEAGEIAPDLEAVLKEAKKVEGKFGSKNADGFESVRGVEKVKPGYYSTNQQNIETEDVKRTEPKKFSKELLPYGVDVVCLDQAGIVHNLAGFFAERNIEIGEVTTRSYPAPHTGTAMFSVQMFINIPADLHISELREEFMEFSDQLNLDAIMEPVKNS